MKISYSKIENECNQLHTLARDIQDVVEDIRKLNNSLKENYWEGSASNNYTKKMNSLLKQFDSIVVEIENSVLYLANCSEGYQAVDKMVMNEICNNLKITSPNLGKSKIF